MTDTQQRVDLVVRTIAQTAIDNETYFGDLDSVVGDGDFGYSLARGFEKVIEGWDDIDRTNPGTFLKKVGMIVSSRIGGTSATRMTYPTDPLSPRPNEHSTRLPTPTAARSSSGTL